MNSTLNSQCAFTQRRYTHDHQSRPDMPRSARLILRLLDNLKVGTLTVVWPDGHTTHHGNKTAPVANITIRTWHVCTAALKSGDIGFAESYIAGEWTSTNLAALLELIVVNRQALQKVLYGTWWGTVLERLRHALNRNTRAQAKKNIQAHYDLGNDFYRLWLDESMTYSSALFDGAVDTFSTQALEPAQQAKYQRVLAELEATKGAKLLEIGCGWGGFAAMATQAGMTIKGLTLSEEQLAYSQQRLPTKAARFQLQDYRNEHGQYDGIASIEMFEAVGQAYWPSYFDCIKRNLKPGAKACIQSIVIADRLFEQYRKGTDFIQQYIFPGGMLPSASVFRAEAERAGLRVINEFSFGLHYAETLRRWRERFLSQLTEVRAQGYDERFILTWEFYLAYCEAAFKAGDTSVMHFTLQA